jgi:hypothetical protein
VPSIGRVNFNTYYLEDLNTNQDFEELLDTTIHEIIHVLGFSSYFVDLFIDPSTGDYYSDQSEVSF